MKKLSATATTTAEETNDPDQNHGAEDCHDKTVDIEAGNTCGTEEVLHDKAADECTSDTADHVFDAAHLLVLAGDDAGDPTCQCAEYDSNKNVCQSHVCLRNWFKVREL